MDILIPFGLKPLLQQKAAVEAAALFLRLESGRLSFLCSFADSCRLLPGGLSCPASVNEPHENSKDCPGCSYNKCLMIQIEPNEQAHREAEQRKKNPEPLRAATLAPT